jgi:hypothetical protein
METKVKKMTQHREGIIRDWERLKVRRKGWSREVGEGRVDKIKAQYMHVWNAIMKPVNLYN